MDLEKYQALFVTESREILDSFQSELLKAEKADAGREAIDAMFRAAHSLKGMASSMGYDGFAELAHAMEDLASDARTVGNLATDAVDLLLEGVDRLTAVVDAVDARGDGGCDPSDLIERIHSLHDSVPAAATAVAGAGAQAAGAAQATPKAPREGEQTSVTRVAISFSEQSQAPQVRAFMLQRQLSEQFDVVALSPNVDDLKAGRFPDRTLTVTLRVGPGELDRFLELARGATDVSEVSDLGPPQRPRVEVTTTEQETQDTQRTVRVRTEILDEFIDSVGELLRARDRLRTISDQLELPQLTDISDELVVLTKELHDRVMAARMTPLSVLTERLPRVVRDLARRRGHEVDFTVEGADIELDRALLDELHSALLHIVRNAVDHGHEGADRRRQADKTPALNLVVRASRDRDHVLLEVEDDGRGIDPAAVRAKAVATGLLDEERATALSDAEAIELICAPGFSTAEQVSDVSGRGVGMDAVRSTVERLAGDLQIGSQPGTGTCFTLRLPLTMAIIGVMLVERDASVYAIPTNRVSYARDFSPVFLSASCGEALLRVDDELLPYFDLGDLLGHSPRENVDEGTVVLIEDQAGAVAVHVDRIVGMQEVVVKPLGQPLSAIDYLAGAALLPDGRPAFILDIGRLVRWDAAA